MKEITPSMKRATANALKRIAELKIQYHNLPEKTPEEYWAKCKELSKKKTRGRDERNY